MSTEPRRSNRTRQRGVTLIELILFIMIVGVALTAIVGVMNFTTSHSADPVRRKQALMLAEAFLEEVELAKFSICDVFDPNAGDIAVAPAGTPQCTATFENWGKEANNVRPFDNVNDYVTAPGTEAETFGAIGNLQDANGNTLPLTGFKVTVTVAPDTLGSIANPGTSYRDTRVLRITVAVTYDGQTLSLDGYRTRYAPTQL